MGLRNTVSQEKKDFAKKLRKEATLSERIFWELTRNNQLGVKFRRQVVLRGWIVDFYIPQFKLAIELDGKYHEERKDLDAIKDKSLNAVGIRVLRLPSKNIFLEPLTAIIKALKNLVRLEIERGVERVEAVGSKDSH